MLTSHSTIYDLLIIGGGINGTGIALDAAQRGLKVYLCEQDDLAHYTSSKSSKLIHGGLRYLEYYDFRLVREALRERDILLHIAPHLIRPLSFIIPHSQRLRPAWMIKAGLFLYDLLGKRLGRKSSFSPSRRISLTDFNSWGKPIKSDFKQGFFYTDGQTDDARLVVLNAVAAKEQDAVIQTRTVFLKSELDQGYWRSFLKFKKTDSIDSILSRAIVNAAGPWADAVNQQLPIQTSPHIELVQGSHILVPKLYEGDHAYLLQHQDQRIVFVIPYESQFTIIGTTDIAYNGDPQQAVISAEEEEYLCEAVNVYFKKSITPSDIVYRWSGVRPLQAQTDKNISAVTRDYTFELNTQGGRPILSIFGGKLTTYRKLAEHALNKLKPFFPGLPETRTDSLPLPGGDFQPASLPLFIEQLCHEYPAWSENVIKRYALQYGTRCRKLLNCEAKGRHFGHGLFESEVRYLIETEWAQTAEDILWRRTKLGLFFTQKEAEDLEIWLLKQPI